jgi:uncharacterized protein involved in exopolysaccharide biosynthesis
MSSHPSSQLVVVDDQVVHSGPMEMPSQEEQGGMSVSQIVTIMAAYWKTSLLIIVSVIFLAGVAIKLMAKTYTATATLMVNYDINDPLAGKDAAVGNLATYIETQIQLMLSPDVLDSVIERMNLVGDADYAAGNRGGTATLRDWVETKLRKNLEIEEGKGGSQLINITASATNATQASDLANAVADSYTEQQYQRVNGPASERAKRYTEELSDLKKKVAAAQEAVTRFRARTGAIDLDAKVDVDMDLLTSLEHRLLDTRNSLRSSQARTAGNQNVSSQVLTSNTVQTLRGEEAKLKSRMAQLRTTLGPNHPQVVELQSQIDANASSLAAALQTYSNATSSDIAVSSSEVASLEGAVSAQRQKVMEGRNFRDEGAKYQLELEAAQVVYKRALDGYDQIMFASTGHLTNVNIASRARPPVKPDKPNPIKYLLLGAILGIGLGIAGPFAYELLHRRVRCRDDVERDFGIPILTEILATEPARLAAS